MNPISLTPTTADHRTKLQDGGRLVIPADFRKALGLAVGEEMILRLKDGEIHIYPARQALARAQRLIRQYDKSENIVDELIADRRREASRE